MIIQVCVGSACHLKGSHDIIDLLKEALKEHKLDNDVALAGCFCTGKCNCQGVTVQVDDEVVTGITKENFNKFFEEKILKGA